MFIDSLELFSDAQEFTTTAVSTNVIDLLPTGGAINSGDTGGPTANTTINLGSGKPLYLYVQIDTSVGTASGDTSTVFTLESDDNTSLTSATTHWTSDTFATNASLAAGTWVAKGIPIPSGAYQRYLGIRATISTQNWNAGKVNAWLSDTPFSDEQYRSGITTGIN